MGRTVMLALLFAVLAIAHYVHLAPLRPEGSCILYVDGQTCGDGCKMKGFNAGECVIYLCQCNNTMTTAETLQSSSSTPLSTSTSRATRPPVSSTQAKLHRPDDSSSTVPPQMQSQTPLEEQSSLTPSDQQAFEGRATSSETSSSWPSSTTADSESRSSSSSFASESILESSNTAVPQEIISTSSTPQSTRTDSSSSKSSRPLTTKISEGIHTVLHSLTESVTTTTSSAVAASTSSPSDSTVSDAVKTLPVLPPIAPTQALLVLPPGSMKGWQNNYIYCGLLQSPPTSQQFRDVIPVRCMLSPDLTLMPPRSTVTITNTPSTNSF